MKFKKLVLYDFKGSDFLERKLREFCEELAVFRTTKDFSDDMKPENLAGAEALVAKPFGNYDKAFFSNAGKLKYFGFLSTGYSAGVDLDYLREKSITFTNVPHYSTESVAELTFSVLLEIERKTCKAMADAKNGRYTDKREIGFELQGKTLGIVGLGAIGARVAEIAKGFGMNVVYYSRTRKQKTESDLGIKYVGLDELLKNSDIVSLHCSLNDETRSLINKEKLCLLKDGAILLNSARADICDLDAVKEVAKNGKVFFWFEALDEPEQREKLLGIGNIIATPHIGWMTKEAQQRLDEIAVENVKNFLDGKPSNVVQ